MMWRNTLTTTKANRLEQRVREVEKGTNLFGTPSGSTAVTGPAAPMPALVSRAAEVETKVA